MAVVGAGTAGAATAAQCARRGLITALLEAGDMEQAGARWSNLVPLWLFMAAGVPMPQGEEDLGLVATHHLYAGHGPEGIRLCGGRLMDVDMRLLVRRLQQAAASAGAMLLPRTRITGWDGELLRTSGPTLEPRWVVDASGLHGARLMGQPMPGEHSICDAVQQVHRVADRPAAATFFATHGAALGDFLTFAGLHGGFSTISLRVEGEHVGVLAGAVPGDGHPRGAVLIRRLLEGQPWIGERLFGGGREIPIRRPYDRLAQGKVALVGDAACQVFPPHGSGVGYGLVAARLLADALGEGCGVEGYATEFQRRYGGTLAAEDIFRRFQQGVTRDRLARLMSSGLISDDVLMDSYCQRFPQPGPGAMARLLARARLEPALAAELVGLVSRMSLVKAYYRLYPSEPSRVAAWASRLSHFGLTPDMVTSQ